MVYLYLASKNASKYHRHFTVVHTYYLVLIYFSQFKVRLELKKNCAATERVMSQTKALRVCSGGRSPPVVREHGQLQPDQRWLLPLGRLPRSERLVICRNDTSIRA